MSNYQFHGVLKVKGDIIQVSDKFSKREFVVTDSSSQYPQEIQFQLAQDKCSLLDNIQLNESITVSFNLRGRLWINPQGEAKYFNQLDAWRIEKTAGSIPTSQPAVDPNPPTYKPEPNLNPSNDDDSLPFSK